MGRLSIVIFRTDSCVCISQEQIVSFRSIVWRVLIPACFKEVSPVLFAERYLYLPSAGFFMAVISFPLKRLFHLVIAIPFYRGISYSAAKYGA